MEEKSIFISHASNDYDATEMNDNLCELLKKKYYVECSSQTVMQGFLHDEINKKIARCDVFFALITENYVRSPYCLYELSVASYTYFQEHKKSQENSEDSKYSQSSENTKLTQRAQSSKIDVFVVVTANDDVRDKVKALYYPRKS